MTRFRTCFRCGDSSFLWSLVRFNCAFSSAGDHRQPFMRTSRALSLIRIFACYVVDVSVVELLNPFVTCQVPQCSRFGTADHGQLLLKDSLINRCGTPWQPQVYLLLAWEVSVVVVIFISIKHNNNNNNTTTRPCSPKLRLKC